MERGDSKEKANMKALICPYQRYNQTLSYIVPFNALTFVSVFDKECIQNGPFNE